VDDYENDHPSSLPWGQTSGVERISCWIFIADWLRNRKMVEFLGIWERVHNPGFNYGEFAVVKSQTGQSTAPPHQFLSWALPDDRFLAVVAVLAPAAVSSTPDGGCCCPMFLETAGTTLAP
jgi:hypothetical protein